MEEYFFRDYTCSECGRKFTFSTQINYKYKTCYSGKMEYQCGYTCYDHILLRYDNPNSYYPEDRYKEKVQKCERAMKGQGKEILHPIKL